MKWLWSDMKMNCSAGFKNVDSTRAVKKTGRLNGKWKGVDETHLNKEYKRIFHKVENEF